MLLEAFRRYLKVKHNFEVDQKIVDRYKEFAIDGIHWTEEQCAQKKKAGEELPNSVKKLDMTLGYTVEAAKLAGLPAWAEGQLRKIIESCLNVDRG